MDSKRIVNMSKREREQYFQGHIHSELTLVSYMTAANSYDDIIAFLEAQPLAQDGTAPVDIKALKIELKANNFYRGNPYIDTVGTLLSFTKEQLDEFFETNDYTKLITQETTQTPVEEN